MVQTVLVFRVMLGLGLRLDLGLGLGFIHSFIHSSGAAVGRWQSFDAVSYTHLTLPTILRV